MKELEELSLYLRSPARKDRRFVAGKFSQVLRQNANKKKKCLKRNAWVERAAYIHDPKYFEQTVSDYSDVVPL